MNKSDDDGLHHFNESDHIMQISNRLDGPAQNRKELIRIKPIALIEFREEYEMAPPQCVHVCVCVCVYSPVFMMMILAVCVDRSAVNGIGIRMEINGNNANHAILIIDTSALLTDRYDLMVSCLPPAPLQSSIQEESSKIPHAKNPHPIATNLKPFQLQNAEILGQ